MDILKDENFNIVKEIPQIPEAFKRVNDTLRDQSIVNSFLDYIEEDNNFKQKIINIANSRYFLTGQNVQSIRSITLNQGIMKLKNMIMIAALRNLMNLNEEGFNDLWEHSLKCAVACEILAKEFNTISSDDAFSLGFLHDIGKTILYKNNTKAYRECIDRSISQEEDIIAIENELFNTNHSADGVMILRKWEMPRILIDCIKYHHTPTLSTMPTVSGIIYTADKIVKCNNQIPSVENSLLNRLGLYISDIKNFKLNVEVKSNFILEALN